jgi:Fic family protein
VSKHPRTGSYVAASTTGEKFKAFIPAPLPFQPPLDLAPLQSLIEQANQALGRLDGMGSLIPDTSHLIYSYVRKEALLSSQIEGTQSSFDDLLLYESDAVPGVPVNDVEEVSHYIAAMQHGLKRMEKGFPLSLRLIGEMHAILLRGGRGHTKQPGEFRRSQNWIGGTRPGNAVFVPPPAEKMMECLGNLELYMHDHFGKTPTLLKAAIVHVQFETIHPFLDGNGRIGRLLITLLLCSEGVLTQPVLYLSLYFKRHRKVYYDLLNRVRTEGVWEKWIEYFLEGVIETANEATEGAKTILELFAKDTKRIGALKRAAPSALKVFEYLQQKVMGSIPQMAESLELSQPTVTASLKNLENLDIVKEVSGRKKDRVFVYAEYLKILRVDMEPL